MSRSAGANLSMAGLVASVLVFAWPQLSLSVPGASPSYPMVTALFTLLIVAIVVCWPAGDSTAAATARITPAAVAAAIVAAAIVAGAAYRWTRLLAWQPYQADMLIVIREATRRFLGGHTPYTTYRTYDAPWTIAMPYGPALWAPYLVPQLLRLDFRFLTVIGELFVPLWCGVAGIVEAARGRAAAAAGWLALLASLALLFDVQGFTLIGHTPVYWPLLPLLAVAVGRSRWTAAACLLGLLIAARTTMLAIVPVFLIAAWISDRRRFPRCLGTLLATVAFAIVPFIVWDAKAVWDNMVLSYPRVMKEAVWPVLARPGIETIGLTEWLLERHREALVVPVQLLAMAAVYGVAWQALRRRAAPLPWMALALFAFSMTTLYPVHYLYYDVLLLLACAAIAGALGSGPLRLAVLPWAASTAALVILLAAASYVVAAPFPHVVPGDDASAGRLGAGFAMAESDGDQRFSWMIGREATIILPRRSAQAAAIVLIAESAFDSPEAPQGVTAILNGTVLGHTTVPSGWGEIRFNAPRSTWWVGFNQLRLVASSAASPRASGRGDDARELALAIRRVSVVRAND